MIRGGSGAETTPRSSHDLQARFSRLLTSTKYFAGSTSSWELSSWPITTVSFPQPLHTHCSGVHFRIRSTRGRFAGSSCRPGCWRLVFVESWTGGAPLPPRASPPLTPCPRPHHSPLPFEELLLPPPRIPAPPPPP